MKHLQKIASVLALATIGLPQLHAAVSEDEAKQLGGPALTLFGSEKAGNKEGTIPAYTGTGPKIPAGWNEQNPNQRPNPYKDKPLFSITAENAAQYADKLDGSIEMFKRYPNFRMDIYPTHRDYRMPEYVLNNTVKNATTCKTANKELNLQGCYGGLPFPIPKTGNEAMWNHLVSYHGWIFKARAEVWVVPPNGEASMVDRVDFINNWPYYDPSNKGPLPADQIYFRYLGKDEAPARLVGGQFMILDPVDQLGIGRKAYLYVPGRRWVKLAANLAYDTPTPYGGGSATMDDSKAFFGALDRYNFELVGKKEKFIYYNNYETSDVQACPAEKYHQTKGFPNPDCVRWELHRVWVVKATLKPGMSHIYPKRMLYWDEDGFVAGMAENYDANGKMFRLTHNIFIPHFEAPGGQGGSNTYLDLQSGIWVTSGYMTCANCGGRVVTTPLPEDTFLPDTMAGAGIR